MILELGHEHETLVDFYGVVIVFVGACVHTHAHVVMQLAIAVNNLVVYDNVPKYW
jgi:hypothetical protein